jgi:uncharacterized membrane protein HdeD (DUF308 family)
MVLITQMAKIHAGISDLKASHLRLRAYGGLDFAYPLRHTVTFALAIYLFVEAILEFSLGFKLRPRPGWGWLLFDGIVTLILAIMIWRTWPSSTAWVVGTLVGIGMFFSGISRFMVSMAARRVISKA